MNWSFSGNIQALIELFERELIRYEKHASETSILNQRTGMVLNRLDSGPLTDHLLLNSWKHPACSSRHAHGCRRTW